jgi:hypothetical protein
VFIAVERTCGRLLWPGTRNQPTMGVEGDWSMSKYVNLARLALAMMAAGSAAQTTVTNNNDGANGTVHIQTGQVVSGRYRGESSTRAGTGNRPEGRYSDRQP